MGATQLSQVRCSELELEGELGRTRAADLVEGVETGIISAGETAGWHLRRMAKEGLLRVLLGLPKLGEVEELASETKPMADIRSPCDFQRELKLTGRCRGRGNQSRGGNGCFIGRVQVVVDDRGREIRVIQHVEELRPELNVEALRNPL